MTTKPAPKTQVATAALVAGAAASLDAGQPLAIATGI
jgi:hypothetical protein